MEDYILLMGVLVGFLIVFIPSLIQTLLFRKQMLDKRKREYEEWKKKIDAEMEEWERMIQEMRQTRQTKGRGDET